MNIPFKLLDIELMKGLIDLDIVLVSLFMMWSIHSKLYNFFNCFGKVCEIATE